MTLAALRDAVLALPSKDRAALAAELLESLDDQIDEDAAASWEAEIERRAQEVEQAEVNTLPASEVMKRLDRTPSY
jgi:putative addiction module component (TIGR02574 family)